MTTRAENIDRSREWWEKALARGQCTACHRAIADDATIALHPACRRLMSRGYRVREIRKMSTAQIEATAKTGRWRL